MPIEQEQGRYFLAEYTLGKLSYKDIKHFSAISGTSKLYPKLDNKRVVDVLNPMTSEALKVQGHSYENLVSLSEDFDVLGGAIVNHYKVTFVYSEKSREVHPYKLLNNNDIWYLLATEDGVLKHFTFSKIKSLCINKDCFRVESAVAKTI